VEEAHCIAMVRRSRFVVEVEVEVVDGSVEQDSSFHDDSYHATASWSVGLEVSSFRLRVHARRSTGSELGAIPMLCFFASSCVEEDVQGVLACHGPSLVLAKEIPIHPCPFPFYNLLVLGVRVVVRTVKRSGRLATKIIAGEAKTYTGVSR
jgi:hypothetical protein